jgi:hypothetical protein
MTKYIALLLLTIAAGLAVGCGGSGTGTGSADSAKTIKQASAGNNLTATLASSDGVLRKGKQTLTLKFADASGKPVDVGSASLNFHMPAMGTMAVMNNAATLTTTGTPGVYSGSVDIEMSGEWEAQIAYQGPAGTGKANMPVTAQ